jgi:hypothetical protein
MMRERRRRIGRGDVEGCGKESSGMGVMSDGEERRMDEKYNGITTAINLLESARIMRYPDDIRRNITLARSALYDVLVTLDSMSARPPGLSPRSRSGGGMFTVTIKCRVTGAEIPTDIKIDEESFRTAIFADNQIKCSSCGQWHQWSTEDAFLR